MTNPLVVNGHTYTKIGWTPYDQELGYGWYGDMAHVMYRYLTSGPNELQKSILYDDHTDFNLDGALNENDYALWLQNAILGR